MRSALLTALLLLAVGCSEPFEGDFTLDVGFVFPDDAGFPDAGPGPDIGFPYTFADDVLPILQTKCHGCHGEQTANLAPRSLFSYEDLTRIDPRTNLPVHALVVVRIQSSDRPMPPPSSGFMLSASEIAVLTVWSQTGAP